MSKNAKQQLYEFIDNLRRAYKISETDINISTTDLCYRNPSINLQFHNFKTPGLCGTALLGDECNTIILNSRRDQLEQNFDCGHELVHCHKHRNLESKTFNCFVKTLPQQDTFIEWEANEGSAELLVPYRQLLPKIKQQFQNLQTWNDVIYFKSSLASDYGVSEAVIQIRLESLKYEMCQHLRGVPIDKVKILSNYQKSTCGIYAKSLNDIESDLFLKSLTPPHG